jgi:hypothetical protein
MYVAFFANITNSNNPSIYQSDNSDSSSKIINCTFQNMSSTGAESACISIFGKYASYNVSLCLFKNLSSSSSSRNAVVISYLDAGYGNGNNNFSENTFLNIVGYGSSVSFNGNFDSLYFINNTFTNCTNKKSGSYGGVYFIYIILFYYFFTFLIIFFFCLAFLYNILHNININRCCFFKCTAERGFFFFFF